MESLFILDSGGQLLTSRHYRTFPGTSSQEFNSQLPSQLIHVIASRSHYQGIPPVFVDHESGSSYVSLSRDGIILSACLTPQANMDPLLVIYVLESLCKLLQTYYRVPLADSIIKSNFNTLYPIMDEVIEMGYPFATELSGLEATVVPPSLSGIVDKLATVVSGNSPSTMNSLTGVSPEIWWRRAGVFHTSNEFYVDVRETVNFIGNFSGKMIAGSIGGKISINSRLSGLPDCLLTFKDSKLFGEIGTLGFHPCVRLARWHRDQKLSFTPPDGEFVLADYIVRDKSKVVLPFNLNTAIQFDSDRGTLSVSVSPKLGVLDPTLTGHNPHRPGSPPNQKPQMRNLEDLVIKVKLPKSVGSATLITQTGTAHFDASTGIIVWSPGSIKPESSAPVKLDGTLLYGPQQDAAARAKEFRCSATAQFLVRGWNPTGVKIETLDVNGVDYSPYKGCRYSTSGGSIDIRI